MNRKRFVVGNVLATLLVVIATLVQSSNGRSHICNIANFRKYSDSACSKEIEKQKEESYFVADWNSKIATGECDKINIIKSYGVKMRVHCLSTESILF